MVEVNTAATMEFVSDPADTLTVVEPNLVTLQPGQEVLVQAAEDFSAPGISDEAAAEAQGSNVVA